jgi:hypothetical protein
MESRKTRKAATNTHHYCAGNKNDLVWLFAGLAEMSKTFYFVKHSYFGAIGRPCGADRFFSPAQYCAGNIQLSDDDEQIMLQAEIHFCSAKFYWRECSISASFSINRGALGPGIVA